MSTFINIDLDGNTPRKYIGKHVVFAVLWIFSIAVFLFRLDVHIAQVLEGTYWLSSAFPIILLAFLLFFTLTQGWYSLAFIFYPALVFFWFAPKMILVKGKFYLFCHYCNTVFRKLKHFKQSIIHLTLFVCVTVMFFIMNNYLAKWSAIITLSYFYVRYVVRYISQSFMPAHLFDLDLEMALKKIVTDEKSTKSLILNSYVIQERDEKLSPEERSNKRLSRLVLVHYGLNYLSGNLNSFKGRKAYFIALLFELLSFAVISILFFWFVNYQVYQIDRSNFIINGFAGKFEFLYYTLKTVTFGDIQSILPHTQLAKLVEILCFLSVGVLVLVVATSLFFSFKQDKLNNNIQLATAICNNQNQIIIDYVKTEYNTDIANAMNEIATIKESVDRLRAILRTIF